MRDLQRDLEIIQAATPEPWEIVPLTGIDGPYAIRVPRGDNMTWYGIQMIALREDACFISAARNGGWEETIRRAMKAEAQVKELETVLTATRAVLNLREERLAKLRAKCRTAKEALRKLRNLLLEFGGLDGRVWWTIDEALAALEEDEQK